MIKNKIFVINKILEAWIAQGTIALIWLVLIPTDANNNSFLGFTPFRLVLVGILLFFVITSIVFRFYSYRFLENFLNSNLSLKISARIYFICFLGIFILPALLFVLFSVKSNISYALYAQRLMPLIICFWLALLELLGALIYFENPKSINALKPTLRIITVFSFIMFVLFLLVFSTKIGITSDQNIGSPGIPVLEWQIFLIFLLALYLLYLPKQRMLSLKKYLPFLIYLFTVTLWLSQPINPAFTATPPRAPNFEIYPYSDPQIYSQYAQSALVGNGFLYPEVPSRAFYVAILTWLHLFSQQNYVSLIILQTLLLAFFPVVLYLIGKEFGSNSLGLILAALIAFRDVNANVVVPFASNVTYSKLLLSEMPLALFLSIVTLITIRWLKAHHQSVWMPLLIGCLLAIATLIRTQSIALIVVILFFAFLTLSTYKQFIKSTILMIVALTLTLLPWLTRNYIASGGITLDNSISQVMTMARRWNGSWGNESLTQLEGETEAQYSSRMTQVALDAFKRNPQFIIQTAANHFVNSEIVSLMILPVRHEIHSPKELLIPDRSFWNSLTSKTPIIFFAYLIFFTIGIAIAFYRYGWLGLFPLILGFGYNAWTALFFSSGERFVAPLDWSILLYQILGMLGFGSLLLLAFTTQRDKSASFLTFKPILLQSTDDNSDAFARKKLILTCSLILVISLFTPVTEFIFPQKYNVPTLEEFKQKTGYLPEETETIIYARAIYPRYYESGEGEPYSAKLGYGESETPRLVFFMVGSENGLVIFDLKTAPQFFPHASDVYLIGSWKEEGYFSPRIAYVSKIGQTAIYEIK